MPLSDDALISILRKEEQVAANWQDAELSGARQSALKYYNREPYGDEEDGQSKVVTSEFFDAVEAAMPSMMRVFTGAESSVEFAPTGPGQEQWAREASAYIPHVLNVQNDGFRILYWFIKDALAYRLSCATVDVEEKEHTTREPIEGWTREQMAMAEQIKLEQGATEVAFEVEQDQPPPPPPDEVSLDGGMLPAVALPTFSGTLVCTHRKKRVVVDNVASEDLLISPAEARDIDAASFVGYRKQVTASDLTMLGLSKEEIDNLSADRRPSAEEDQRQGGLGVQNPRRDSERRLWLVVAYLKADDDDDGISEMLRVVYAHAGGTAGAIIERMEWPEREAPITVGSVILMSHTLVGRSLFDQTQDLQDVGTQLTRGMLDNLYLTNRPRPAINGRVSIVSVLDWTPGMPIHVQGNENPANAISWLQVPSVIAPALSALEYMAGVRENRTGIVRQNQGLEADTLNKTASGMSMLMGAANQRLELFARTLAETAIKRLYRLIYRACKRAAEGPVQYWTGGTFTTVDPTKWPDDMDLSVNVGAGTRDQAMQGLTVVAQVQEKLVALQGGTQGPFVTAENIANAAQRVQESVGYKTPGLFFQPPEVVAKTPPPQPPPPAELVKVQMQAQADMHKATLDAQIRAWEARERMKLEYAKLGIQAQLDTLELHQETQLKALDLATRPKPNIPQAQVQ